MSRKAKAYDCATCKWGRHCDDSNPAPTDNWFEIPGVIKSGTCLLPMITPQSRYLLRLYGHYKNRLLPYAGGLLNQPNYYIEAMEHIAAVAGDYGRDPS